MIHFDKERMKRVEEAHLAFWEGTLGRPLLNLELTDAYQVEHKARAPYLAQPNCHQFEYSPEEVIEAVDEELSRHEFLADGYPRLNFAAFGPGVLAAFCGAKLEHDRGQVWFFPEKELPLSEIHVKYDPDNMWVRRIKDIYKAGLERWEGLVKMGMPDLGGVMDVAATFRGSENLLLDLYDDPEEVKRLIGEIEIAWYEAYNDFSNVLEPQGGHTDWSGLWSPTPSYITQCDFCYMISPDMYREFVHDTLVRDTGKLANVIYHLDGIGELPHLSQILSIPELNAIQWVPGAGQKEAIEWAEVHKTILDAGKRLYLTGDVLPALPEFHNNTYVNVALPRSRKDYMDGLMKYYK